MFTTFSLYICCWCFVRFYKFRYFLLFCSSAFYVLASCAALCYRVATFLLLAATILSDQLASLSTGLEAKSRLLEARSRGSRRPEAWKNLAFFYDLLGIPSNS